MAGGTTFTWKHALQLHSTLSPFDSPVPITHSTFKDARPVSWRRLNVAGILCTIYGLDELEPFSTTDPHIACLWLLHGRGDTQDSMGRVAAAFLHSLPKHPTTPTRKQLICITLDQRNHGSRLVDDHANISWSQGNETHAQDMFATYSGTAVDVSHLMTHLPGYLFNDNPHGPVEWTHLGCGLSLGGHATWQLLLAEPRLRAACVVVGCPDYVRLMTDRAVRSKRPSCLRTADAPGSEFLGSIDFPPGLIEAVRKGDPAGRFCGGLEVVKAGEKGENIVAPGSREDKARVRGSLDMLRGKRILCLSGGKDRLVPYQCSEPFLTWLKEAVDRSKGWCGDLDLEVRDIVDPEAKHEFSKGMLIEAERWLGEVLAQEGSQGAMRDSSGGSRL